MNNLMSSTMSAFDRADGPNLQRSDMADETKEPMTMQDAHFDDEVIIDQVETSKIRMRNS